MSSKQLQTLKQHGEQLAQFIIRLSAFYEGFSKEIDEELHVLRGHLAGQPNITLSTLSINKLNGILMSTSTSLKQYRSATVKELEDTIKHIQLVAEAFPEHYQESTKYLNEISAPTQSIFTLVNHCLKALELYRKSTAEGLPKPEDAAKKAVPQTLAAVSSAQEAINASVSRLQGDIVAELNQLVDTYAMRTPNDEQLIHVRSKLHNGITEEELLQCCVFLIRLIVRDTLGEVNVTGKVINGLHKAIGEVNQSVTETIETSKNSLETKLKSNQELKDQIDDMEDAVNQSESLEKLKQDAQKYLTKMASTISQQEESDRAEQEALVTLLDQMQKQLTQLQKQTHNYRRKLAEQRISTYTDSLTKIPNRVAYNERVQREWEVSKSTQSPLCMALVDIDHFKTINDKYGHAAGDKTLQVIARHLKKHAGANDFLARWGGEEFVMLFPGVSIDELTGKLEAIRATLEALPFKFKQEKVTITASIGAACCIDGEQIDKTFDRADENLYQAKNSGRNRVVVTA